MSAYVCYIHLLRKHNIEIEQYDPFNFILFCCMHFSRKKIKAMLPVF